ncbi:hypothetical protein SAMN04488018_11442 [Myroides marinus]|jgi:ABC-type iron transport system FetAB permease component|uniref:Lmo0937 family membrane protein n=1 Tax=Myroides marinus TaxID=703342 RepID=A0A1H6WSP3_9FLAO|nr:hypothetical protein SAMN04488018_11442 [Myroides marinus]
MKDLLWILVILLLTAWYLLHIIFNVDHFLVTTLLLAATILSVYNYFFIDNRIKNKES